MKNNVSQCTLVITSFMIFGITQFFKSQRETFVDIFGSPIVRKLAWQLGICGADADGSENRYPGQGSHIVEDWPLKTCKNAGILFSILDFFLEMIFFLQNCCENNSCLGSIVGFGTAGISSESCALFLKKGFFSCFFFFCVCVWFYGRTFTLESCRSFMKEKPEGEWRFKKLVSWKHLEKNQRLGVWTLGVNETAFYGFCCKGLKIFCTISQEFSHHRRVLISLSPAGAHSLTAHLGALSSDRRTMPASALHQIAPNVPWCNEVSRFQAQLWEGICLFRNAALSHWNNIEMKPAAACVDAMADIVPTDA